MYAFSITDLRKHYACDLNQRIADLRRYLVRDVPEDEDVPMAVWAEVTPNTSDLIWALRCRPEGEVIAVEIARRAAKHVRQADPLSIFAVWVADDLTYAEDAARVGNATTTSNCAARAVNYARAGKRFYDARADILELTA